MADRRWGGGVLAGRGGSRRRAEAFALVLGGVLALGASTGQGCTAFEGTPAAPAPAIPAEAAPPAVDGGALPSPECTSPTVAPLGDEGTCGDTTTSPEHCGTCGRACRGTNCVAGRCDVPAVVGVADVVDLVGREGRAYVLVDGGARVAVVNAKASPPAVLSHWQLRASARRLVLVPEGDGVLVTSGTDVVQYREGREPTALFTAPADAILAATAGLVVASSPSTATVLRYDLAAQRALEPLKDLRGDLVAVDGARLVVADGARLRRRVDVSTTRDLATFEGPIVGLVLVGRHAYAMAGEDLFRVDVDATSPAAERVAYVGLAAQALATDGVELGWTEAPFGRCDVRAVPVCGGPRRRLATGLASCRGLALVGDEVWFAAGPALFRQPR